MKQMALGLLAALMSAGAMAQTPPGIEGKEVIFNLDRYIGKRVTITDCMIQVARMDDAICPIVINGTIVASFRVIYAKADPGARRFALEHCNGFDENKRCAAQVVGRVRKSLVRDIVGLDDAMIYWRPVLR